MKKKLRRTDLYLTERQYSEIKKESIVKGITFSEMFRRLVDSYLDNKDVKR